MPAEVLIPPLLVVIAFYIRGVIGELHKINETLESINNNLLLPKVETKSVGKRLREM